MLHPLINFIVSAVFPVRFQCTSGMIIFLLPLKLRLISDISVASFLKSSSCAVHSANSWKIFFGLYGLDAGQCSSR